MSNQTAKIIQAGKLLLRLFILSCFLLKCFDECITAFNGCELFPECDFAILKLFLQIYLPLNDRTGLSIWLNRAVLLPFNDLVWKLPPCIRK